MKGVRTMPEIINLSGDVGWEITAASLKNRLPKSGDVDMTVNSPGGFIFEGFEIYNVIKDYKGGLINVIINGLAASAASYFIMAADKITIRENSTFMAHKAWSWAVGSADDMELEYRILSGIDSVIARAYERRSGTPKDEILNGMKNEIWLFGNQIIEAGFADESIDDIGDDEQTSEEIQAQARIKVLNTKNKVMETYKDNEEWQNKAVAFYKNSTKPENDNNQPVKEKQNQNKEVSKMVLNAFLKQNPEAQAAYDSSINSAVAEGVLNETERIFEVLNLGGIILSDEVKNAIKNKTDSGVFAKAQLTAQNTARKTAEKQNLGKIDAGVQTPADSVVAGDKPEAQKKDVVDSEEKAASIQL
jgi:ATP-dependent protease ClpP protease subunit